MYAVASSFQLASDGDVYKLYRTENTRISYFDDEKTAQDRCLAWSKTYGTCGVFARAADGGWLFLYDNEEIVR